MKRTTILVGTCQVDAMTTCMIKCCNPIGLQYFCSSARRRDQTEILSPAKPLKTFLLVQFSRVDHHHRQFVDKNGFWPLQFCPKSSYRATKFQRKLGYRCRGGSFRHKAGCKNSRTWSICRKWDIPARLFSSLCRKNQRQAVWLDRPSVSRRYIFPKRKHTEKPPSSGRCQRASGKVGI